MPLEIEVCGSELRRRGVDRAFGGTQPLACLLNSEVRCPQFVPERLVQLIGSFPEVADPFIDRAKSVEGRDSFSVQPNGETWIEIDHLGHDLARFHAGSLDDVPSKDAAFDGSIDT